MTSLASTLTLPTPCTDCALLVLEIRASTFMRTKLSDSAPAPELLLPPAPAAVTLMIWPLIGVGMSTETPARAKFPGRNCRPCEEPDPVEVRRIGRLTVEVASLSVAARLT